MGISWWPHRSTSRAWGVAGAFTLVLGVAGVAGVVAPSAASASSSQRPYAPRASTHAAGALRPEASVHSASTPTNSGWTGLAGGADEFVGTACVSTSVCYAAGDQYNFQTQQPVGVVWKTTDGGSNWTEDSLMSSGYYFETMACSSASECIAVGGNTGQQTTSGADAGIISTWNGSSWTLATLPANTPDVYWAHCAPGGNCFATASDSTGLESTNGGSTWTDLALLTSDNSQGVDTSAPAFADANHGWFVGNTVACDSDSAGCRGVIQHTTDGGTTWNWENTPASMGPMENIACPTTSECIAVGWSGPVAAAYATYDGGGTWTALNLPFGLSNANGVACGDANHCYIVGEATSTDQAAGSVIFATTDGGHTWTVEPIPGPSDGLIDITCAAANSCLAGGYSNAEGTIVITSNGGVPPTGYWFTASDGGVFNFHAPFYGSAGGAPLAKPVVGIALDRISGGYWLAASDGGVFSYGAAYHGSAGAVHLTKPVVGIASTLDGQGYYLVASDGGVFNYGTAKYQGSTGNVHLTQPIVGMAIDRLTGGYWLVAADGGVFNFNAPFYGSAGSYHLTKPIVAILPDAATGGYWLVASDGGVFAFHAPFYGGTGAVHLNQPVVSAAPTPDGHGYWLVAADGGVFTEGDAHFYGSTGNVRLAKPIVGAASSS
jgi:hypothetical protein